MKRMVEAPRDVWLMLAFLASKFEEANKNGGQSYEAIGADYALSKQQVMSLINGRTLGLIKFFDVIDTKWESKPDKLLADARVWWQGRNAVQRRDTVRWAEASEKTRKAANRGGKSTKSEIDRLNSGLPSPPGLPLHTKVKRKRERL